MTRVVLDRSGPSLSAEGHALWAEKGRDLVCAAESALIMTLVKRLSDYEGEISATVCHGPGRVYVSARPGKDKDLLCREIFDTVFAGFRLLAENMPEHVSVRQIDEEEMNEA